MCSRSIVLSHHALGHVFLGYTQFASRQHIVFLSCNQKINVIITTPRVHSIFDVSFAPKT